MAYGANYKEHKPYLHTASKRVIAPSPLSSQFPHFPAFHSSPLSLSPPASHMNYNMKPISPAGAQHLVGVPSGLGPLDFVFHALRPL